MTTNRIYAVRTKRALLAQLADFRDEVEENESLCVESEILDHLDDIYTVLKSLPTE